MEKIKPKLCLPCDQCPSFRNSLFSGLSPEELKKIYKKKGQRRYRRRETLFRPGVKPSGLYCVAAGQVKVFQTGIDGRDQIVRLAQPGDAIGYRALLADEEYTASAVALQDTEVCFIDKSTFFELVDSKPILMRRMIAWLCQDLRHAEDRLRIFAQKPVQERLAETLVLLATTFGKAKSQGIKLDIRLTRLEIAELAGTVLETAVRHLSEFKRRGWLEFEGRFIILKHMLELKRLARLE